METFLNVENGPIWAAPMVRGSELAFRMYLRKYHFQICYTPMIKSELIVLGKNKMELKLLQTCEGDTPLVAQLSGRDPETLYQAAKIVIASFGDNLSAIDLNLGCPQECAKKGKYGAFLLDEPMQTFHCIQALCKASVENVNLNTNKKKIPIFCKIRIANTVEETLKYAKVIENAGAQLLAVHCRIRQSKHDGLPNYSYAKALVNNLKIPIVVNGNVNDVKQAKQIIDAVGCLATMSATAILRNPQLLHHNIDNTIGSIPLPSSLANEYINFAIKYPPPDPLYIRKHFRWIFRNELEPKKPLITDEDWQNATNDVKNGWRVKLWTFLVRPYLKSLKQFRNVCKLYDVNSEGNLNRNIKYYVKFCDKNKVIEEEFIQPTFKSIRKGM